MKVVEELPLPKRWQKPPGRHEHLLFVLAGATDH